MLFPLPSWAADAALDQKTDQLEARLAKVQGRDDAGYAEAAIEHARRALDAARNEDDAAVVSRKQDIALAATVWAERQLERLREQTELVAAQRRLTEARERARAQRRVLEALMRERAELARSGAER